MASNQNLNIEVGELVDTLRRSNIPNIVVEGNDDIYIYRELESRFKIGEVGVHQAGGREKLLQIYEVLSDSEKNGDFSHVPVAFIADRDMWVFRGIPARYNDIIWTNGYSIENDLYSSAKLRNRIRDTKKYDEVLDSISAWFAYKVEEYLKKNPPPPVKIFQSIRDEVNVCIDVHCDRIVPRAGTALASGVNFLHSSHRRVKEIRNEYDVKLRGKTLFDLLVRFLSKPSSGFPKASINTDALYNDAITIPESNALFSRLKEEVTKKFDDQKKKMSVSIT